MGAVRANRAGETLFFPKLDTDTFNSFIYPGKPLLAAFALWTGDDLMVPINAKLAPLKPFGSFGLPYAFWLVTIVPPSRYPASIRC